MTFPGGLRERLPEALRSCRSETVSALLAGPCSGKGKSGLRIRGGGTCAASELSVGESLYFSESLHIGIFTYGHIM